MSQSLENITMIEALRRNELEKIIKKGFVPFMEMGFALAEIKEKKLYRDLYATFEEYCKEKWGFSRTYSYYVIKGSEAIKSLPQHTFTRVNTEKQARAVSKVRPEKRNDVVLAASAKAESEGRPMTSTDITDAASEQEPPVDIESTTVAPEPATPTDTAPTPEPAPAEPRVWPEEEFNKTVTTILTDYHYECVSGELTRSAQFLRDWAKTFEKRAKYLAAKEVLK